MRTNPFQDTWQFFIGQQPDELAVGAWRFVLLAVFFGLLGTGVVIAIRAWREHPQQRTAYHLSLWLFRTMIGCMWFQGSFWKLPPFDPGNGFHYWLQQMVKHGAFDWYQALVRDVLLPAFPLLDPLVWLLEVSFAASLILGVFVRLSGAVGFLFAANLWIGLYRADGEWPWNYVFLAFLMATFSMTAAGRSLGLDAFLHRRAAARAPGRPFRTLVAAAS